MKSKIIKGFGWLGLLRFVNQVTVLIKLGILARILTPAEFGLFAIITTLINAMEALTQTGFDYALIYFKGTITKYARTLLYANLARGILISVIIVFLAFPASKFFNNPGLHQLLLVSSIIPILVGLKNPYVILFSKNLDFKKEFLFRFVPIVIGAIASIYFGLIYKNTLGLLYGLVIGSIAELIFSYIIVKADFSKPFKIKHIKKLFSYGKWLTIGGIVSFLNTQIDTLFVGKFLGVHALGLYDIAFKLANLVTSEVTDTLAKILFPSLSKIQDDPKKVKKYYLYSVIALAIPASIVVLLFVIAPSIILNALLGSEWIDAAPILSILAVYGFMRSVTGPAGPLFLSQGKPKILSLMSILNFSLILILIYPMSQLYGVAGVAMSMALSYGIIALIFAFLVFSFFKKKNLQ